MSTRLEIADEWDRGSSLLLFLFLSASLCIEDASFGTTINE